jgi:hypothetical protein
VVAVSYPEKIRDLHIDGGGLHTRVVIRLDQNAALGHLFAKVSIRKDHE